MSLYAVQKFLYEINRDEAKQQAYMVDRSAALAHRESVSFSVCHYFSNQPS
jgi:hypothetical protein